jgi:glycosyltransferase involved in cell wall biosynthesis
MSSNAIPHVCILTPVYRNQDTLEELYRQVTQILDAAGYGFTFFFINDASPDNSWNVIQSIASREDRVAGIRLLTNVGQQRALLTGLYYAQGDIFVTMDADLQDPPGALPSLLEELSHGYEAVFAGRRGNYQNNFRMLTSHIYKNTLHFLCGIPKDAGLFIAFDQRARSALLDYPPSRTHLAAMLGCARMKLKSIPVPRNNRPSGSSAYTNSMRLRAAWDGISWVLKWKFSRRSISEGFIPSTVEFCGVWFDQTQ